MTGRNQMSEPLITGAVINVAGQMAKVIHDDGKKITALFPDKIEEIEGDSYTLVYQPKKHRGIEIIRFNKPSGDVMGIMTAEAVVGKKEKTICQFHLLTSCDAKVNMKLGAVVHQSELSEICSVMSNFNEALKEQELFSAEIMAVLTR